MNNSKIQQVFYRIILDSLNDNEKWLYKEANLLSSLWKPFRSVWDFGKALLTSRRTGQGLRSLQASGASPTQEQLNALANNLNQIKNYLPDPAAQNIGSFATSLQGGVNSNLIQQIPDILKNISTWQLIKANPFKTIGLGSVLVPTAGGLATGGYYGTRHLVRNLAGTDPDTVRGTIEEGISEGLKKGLQNVGLADEQGKISFTNLTNNLRTDLKGLLSDLGTDLKGLTDSLGVDLRSLMGSLGGDLKGLTGSLKGDLKDLTGNLGGDLRNLMNNVGEDFKQRLTPNLLRHAGTNLGQGLIGSITDPMFQAVGIDPNSISPPLKLLILLGLAGGTFGLASRLARSF